MKRYIALLLCVMSAAFAEDESALQRYGVVLQKEVEILRTITDNSSAEAAVSALAAAEKECNELFVAMSEEDVARTDDIPEENEKWKLLYNLEKAFFYGSTRLAELLTEDASLGLLPQPITPEVQAALAEEVPAEGRFRFGRLTVTYSGGPGFSADTAWNIQTSDGRFLERAKTGILAASIFPDDVSLQGCEYMGKNLARATLSIVRNGVRYEFTQWLNVAQACRQYSPQEQQAAVKESCRAMSELAEAYAGVVDAASAAAAAGRISVLNFDMRLHEDALHSLPTQQMQEANAAMAPYVLRLLEEHKRVKQQKYYGCEQLEMAR